MAYSTPVRTDLVDEAALPDGSKTGLRVTEKTDGGFPVKCVEVLNDTGEAAVGKPRGRYMTCDVGKLWQADKATFDRACLAAAECLSALLPENAEKVLFAALGNRAVTADAVGPLAAEHFLVTSHIRQTSPALFDSMKLRETVCVVPDVLGNTGIEAAQIIRGAVNEARPDVVIAVDSLAARRLERLGTTVQLCDTGISPGSGIRNARKELSRRTLGVPVIAVGVPTVVEAGTLARDVAEAALADRGGAEDCLKQLDEALAGTVTDFFVTPKETDEIIGSAAKLIGRAVNIALQPALGLDEMDELLT